MERVFGVAHATLVGLEQMEKIMSENIYTDDLIEREKEIQDMFDDPDEYGYMFLELKKELAEIEDIENNVEDYQYGEILIHEDNFTEYAMELAEDAVIGLDNHKDNWPYTCIDWERAAEELKQDYFTVEYRGQTYYVRTYYVR